MQKSLYNLIYLYQFNAKAQDSQLDHLTLDAIIAAS
jgi:hypothetical protein